MPGSAGPVTANPDETISQFMAAVNAEDLVTMSRLWGTSRGPAARRLDPVEAERRLRLMQIYLKHDSYSAALDEGQVFTNNEREAHYKVTLTRLNCRPVIPFKLVRSGAGWLVENVNLTEAGNPRRPCAD